MKLFASSATTFATNGLGILSDAISCIVYQVLNGEYELQMEYPVDGIHFSEIAQRSIITAKPDKISDEQPFRVYRITKPLNGIVTIYARHIAYDMSGYAVTPFTAASRGRARRPEGKCNAIMSVYVPDRQVGLKRLCGEGPEIIVELPGRIRRIYPGHLQGRMGI